MTAPMTVTPFDYESREPLMFDDNRTDAQMTDLDSEPTPAAYRAASEEAFQVFLAEQEARKVSLTMDDLIVDPPQADAADDLLGSLEREFFTFRLPEQDGEERVLEVVVERTFRTADGIYLNAHLASPRTSRKGYQYINGSDVSLEFGDELNPEFGSPVPAGAPTSLSQAVAAFAEDVADEHGYVLPDVFLLAIVERSSLVASSMAQSFSFDFDPVAASPQVDSDTVEDESDADNDSYDDYDPNYCEQCGEYQSSGMAGTFYPAVAGYAASVAYEPPAGCFSGGELRGSATGYAQEIVTGTAHYRGQDAGLDRFVELVEAATI